MSGSFGKSESDGGSVWGGQAPYLKDLFAQAQAATGGMDTTQAAQQAGYNAGGIMDTGTGIYNTQGAGGGAGSVGSATSDGLTSALNQNMTGNFSSLDPYSPDAQNQYLDSSVQAGLDQITRNFTQNLLPAIGNEAVDAGQYGSSRQGIAQGNAIYDANQQATDYVNQMYSDNFNQIQDRGLNAASTGLNAQNQAMQLGGNLLAQGDTNQINALQQTGLLSETGFNNINNQVMAQLAPLYGYSGLIGGPAVLGGGSSSISMSGGASSS